LLEVTRRQSILQDLYSFLLQKKLETGISSASTISDIKMLDPARAGDNPISPNKSSLYTIAIFLGLVIPAGIIFLLDFLNDKVKTKNDVMKMTSAPIIGEIGHVENEEVLVVKHNNRAYVSEQFRIMRSNLQYIVPKDRIPIILVTSSFSGEGKSFISTNLGAVIALSGKKTVILEMDIRKPKILKGLGMEERTGLTNYLIGNMKVSDIAFKVPAIDNLFVIPCGPIPPNPAELLLDNKVSVLFEELRKQFDAIIVDTAPVGLVSDAITLGSYCNTSVFIVRHNYTFKKQVPIIDDLYSHKKLPQLSIVINDIKNVHGGYYGYGYGYGLGSSTKKSGGYFESEKREKYRFFKKK
jgi:capsular exopolysaccharide synthesis family protein